MRIALCQINPTVGDIAANARKILDFSRRAAEAGARLAVFPELALLGYPPKDLLLKPQFIEDSLRALDALARQAPANLDLIVGFADRNAHPIGRPLHNAVARISQGRIASRHFKTLLPTYDVFDESRYFEPGPPDHDKAVFTLDGVQVGISICEDLWNDEKLIPRRLYHQNPIAELARAGAHVVINASASPFVVGKHPFRKALFGSQMRALGRPLIYVNQVGGNDELVFDGNSMVLDAQGNLAAQANAFAEDLLLYDLPSPPAAGPNPAAAGPLAPASPDPAEVRRANTESIHQALVLGLRDYVEKCAFKSVVLGLSGGIDSALTAALAVDALGPRRVVGVAMPSRFSSGHSVSDARLLADNLGIEFHTVPIKSIHDQYESALAPAFAGRPADVTEENLQARIRGGLLMAFSNKFGHLLLTTGNKSELAVGYCTLYGDMCGGLAVISDVPKTAVYEISRHINDRAGRPLIPEGSLTKPPSAELRPDQTDQDSLPPYDLLDNIIHQYVEEERSASEIIATGLDAPTVERIVRLIDRSEYKRRQAAPGLKVTSRAFGFGRRMPIAQNYSPFPQK